MSVFSKRFKELRASQNLTQDELAKKLELSKSSISMYENGNREPDFETLELIADYFNVDMNYLLGNTNKTTRFLDSKQFELLSAFDCMNEDGQKRILEYVKDLMELSKYTK